MLGHSWLGGISTPLLSSRNIINMNFTYANEYAFIDSMAPTHSQPFLNGAGVFDTFSLSPFSQLIDQNGYVNNSSVSGQGNYRGIANIPSSSNFTGNWVLTWDGDGTVSLDTFNGSDSFTYTEQNSGLGNYTRLSNGSWQNTAGAKAKVIFTMSGASQPYVIGVNYSATGGTAVNISSYSWSSGVMTVTTSTAHGRTNGASLYLTIAGTSVSSLNGTFFCTITGTNTFTFPLVSNPGTVATPGNMVAYLTNVKFYRQADETDLLAGKIFRATWKQEIANLRPSAIRFMNWSGGNSGQAYSFLDRNTPNLVNWSNSTGTFTTSPAYGRSSGYNNWTVSAVTTGTTSNSKTTPASSTHGEVAIFQIGSAGTMGSGPQVAVVSVGIGVNPTVQTSSAHNLFAGDQIWFSAETGMTQIQGASFNGGQKAGPITVSSITDSTHFVISFNTTGFSSWINASTNFFTRYCAFQEATAISNATTAQVTTPLNHGFSVGDVVVFTGVTGTGWTNLNYFPVTVQSVVNATNFTINFNSNSLGTYVPNSNGGVVLYLTLNVGSRGAFPIIYPFGTFPSSFSNFYIATGSYHCFRFDKTVQGKTDGSGNFIAGAWVFDSNSGGGFLGDVPIEVCTQCVNELNTTSVGLGIATPIHMYWNSTPWGINSTDPDTSSAKQYATNAVNVILSGANGYSGLTSAAHLFIENANECWNFSGIASQYAWKSFTRWGGSTSDYSDMLMLRATNMAVDILSSFPSQTGNGFGQRVHRVLGGPANAGSATTDGYGQIWWTGLNTTNYTNDTLVVSNNWGTPGSNHECMNRAPYVSPSGSYWTGSGAGSFTDDSAMFNGTSPYSSPNQTQAINNFIAQISIAGGIGGLFTHYNSYTSVISSWMPVGKFYIEYEGAADWSTLAGQTYGGHTITSADQAFLLAVTNSSQWGTALTAYFTAMSALPHCAMPAIYIITGFQTGDERWAYCTPDSYASGTEGQALSNNGAWAAMSTRNASLA